MCCLLCQVVIVLTLLAQGSDTLICKPTTENQNPNSNPQATARTKKKKGKKKGKKRKKIKKKKNSTDIF